MEDIFRDGIWQFVGAVLGLIAILLSIAIYFAQRTRKRLSYEIISKTQVVSTSDEVEGKIVILFEGQLVKRVQLLIIELTNTGNVPITANDYERDIGFVFNEEVQILTHEILETSPDNLKAEIQTVNNSIVLKPILLNSGDTITIKLLLSDFNDNIKIEGRIIGVKVIEDKGIKKLRLNLNLQILVKVILFVLAIVMIGLRSDEPLNLIPLIPIITIIYLMYSVITDIKGFSDNH